MVEQNGRSGIDPASFGEADLQYLRNINTKPGQNAGRSIDPTKPGPDDIGHDKQLCNDLRSHGSITGNKAANEIEQLAERQKLCAALRKARHYVRAVFDLIQEFSDQPFILQEIDAALAQSNAEQWQKSARKARPDTKALTREDWIERRLQQLKDQINKLEEDDRKATGWGAAVGARAEWLTELRWEVERLERGLEPTSYHAGLPPFAPYPGAAK